MCKVCGQQLHHLTQKLQFIAVITQAVAGFQPQKRLEAELQGLNLLCSLAVQKYYRLRLVRISGQTLFLLQTVIVDLRSCVGFQSPSASGLPHH